MGKLALAAKITHVPSIYLSELDGPRKGSRQDAIGGGKGRGGNRLVYRFAGPLTVVLPEDR